MELNFTVRSVAEAQVAIATLTAYINSQPTPAQPEEVIIYGLTMRTHNCLAAANIKAADLPKYSANELLMIENLGHKSLTELRVKMAKLDLYLRGDTPERVRVAAIRMLAKRSFSSKTERSLREAGIRSAELIDHSRSELEERLTPDALNEVLDAMEMYGLELRDAS